MHVIDGLLYHETELRIDEHYTDTAEYTDQVFGLSHLLGFRFALRIRDISEIKLYSFAKPSDHPKFEDIIQGKINTKIIRENYDDVRRLAHSIGEGKVSGSLIMSKLARAIFFGKRGELRERELQDQIKRASALNILINAISIWNHLPTKSY